MLKSSAAKNIQNERLPYLNSQTNGSIDGNEKDANSAPGDYDGQRGLLYPPIPYVSTKKKVAHPKNATYLPSSTIFRSGSRPSSDGSPRSSARSSSSVKNNEISTSVRSKGSSREQEIKRRTGIPVTLRTIPTSKLNYIPIGELYSPNEDSSARNNKLLSMDSHSTTFFGPSGSGQVTSIRQYPMLGDNPTEQAITTYKNSVHHGNEKSKEWNSVKESLIKSAEMERNSAFYTLSIARDLYYRIVTQHPMNKLFVDRSRDQMILLASRAAVSCFLIEQSMACLPRHQRVLVPFVGLLVRYLYVSENEDTLDALQSKIKFPEVLLSIFPTQTQALMIQQSPPCATDSDPEASNSSDLNLGSSNNYSQSDEHSEELSDRSSPTSPLVDITKDLTEKDRLIVDIMQRYSRKPYFVAHLELSQRVVAMAYHNRIRSLHFQRLPVILDFMNVSWAKTLMRTVVRAWYKLCGDRRVQEQRQRLRWSHRWSRLYVRIALRRWRSYSVCSVQMAESDTVVRAQIAEKNAVIQKYKQDAQTIAKLSEDLSTSLRERETEVESIKRETVEMEQKYETLIDKVRELDRVGTQLLDSLFLPYSVPSGDITTLACAGSLSILVMWANRLMRLRGVVVEDVIAAEGESEPGTPQLAEGAEDGNAPEVENFEGKVENEESGKESDLGTNSLWTSTLPHSPKNPDEVGVFSVLIGMEGVNGGITGTGNSQSEGHTRLTNATESGEGGGEMVIDDVILLPYYKLLILMRCFEVNESLIPTINTIRAVRIADRPVLEALRKELQEEKLKSQQNNPLTPRSGKVAQDKLGMSNDESVRGNSGTVSPSSAGNRFLGTASATQAAESLARIVYDAYEQLTGTTCIVTERQLLSRRREVLIVFLAALMKYYASWIVRKNQKDMASLDESVPDEALLTINSDGDPSLKEPQESNTEANFFGTRHIRFPNWYHPPSNHREWLAKASRQQQWTAASFSALQYAVKIATTPSAPLTLREQDTLPFYLERCNISQISDLLPRDDPETTSWYFFHLIKSLEKNFRHLRFLFLTYSMPRPQGSNNGGRFSAGKNGNNRGFPKDSRPRSPTPGLPDTVTEGGGGSVGQRSSLQTPEGLLSTSNLEEESERVVSALDFWRMLKDVGLAGDSSKAGCRLHRIVVMGVIEYVAFHTADNPNDTLSFRASTSGGCNSAKSRIIRSPSPQSPSGGANSTSTPIQTTLPYFTRSVKASRHVDMRVESGATLLNAAQFTEALLRCSHCWQCLSAASERNLQTSRFSRLGSRSMRHSKLSMKNSSFASNAIVDAENSVADSTSKNPSSGAGADVENSLSQENSIASSSVYAKDVIRYEPFPSPPSNTMYSRASCMRQIPTKKKPNDSDNQGATYSTSKLARKPWFLSPISADTFLSDWLLPRGLGATSLMPPFRRAMRHHDVREFLSRHHESLFKFFEMHSRPKEAVGIKNALPSPFGSMMAATQYATQEAANDMQVASPYKRSASAAQGTARDVGIVLVVTLDDAEKMAVECGWYKAFPLPAMPNDPPPNGVDVVAPVSLGLTEDFLHECFVAVVADPDREGGVLFFAEFLDLLCSLSFYAQPNPLIPAIKKIENFMRIKVLPFL